MRCHTSQWPVPLVAILCSSVRTYSGCTHLRQRAMAENDGDTIQQQIVPANFPGTPYNPSWDLLYEPVEEKLVLTRDRLELRLQEIEAVKTKAGIEDSFPWLATLMALLLAIV